MKEGLFRVSEDFSGNFECKDYIYSAWGNAGEAVAIYLPISFVLLACTLVAAFKVGVLHHGMAVMATWYLLCTFLLGQHCDSFFEWTSLGLLAACLIGLLLFWTRPSMVKPGGPLNALFTRRIGTATVLGSKDTALFGAANEYLNMTWAHFILVLMFWAWCIVAFVERYRFYTSDDYAGGNYRKSQAFGRAIAHISVRLWWLAESSGHRFALLWGLFGIPYERMVSFHKMAGRSALACFIIHMAIMIHNMDYHGYRFNDSFSWNRVNMWCGLVAFICCVFLVLTSIPVLRRNHFETFYWNHFNFKFMMQVFILLHHRKWILPYMASLILSFYFDMIIRFTTKAMWKAELNKAELVCDEPEMEIARLELSRANFPCKIFDWHPGSYVYLSLSSVNKKQQANPIRTHKSKIPGAVPPLPSMIWFHPMTIASPPSSGKIVLMIKNMGKDKGEWTEDVCKMCRDKVDLSLVKPRLGGPSGRLEIHPEEYNTLFLVCGGIGVTPMSALWGDVALAHKDKYPNVKKVVLLWSVRSLGLVAAFDEWFQWAERCPTVEWDLRVYCTRPGQKNNMQLASGTRSAQQVPMQSMPPAAPAQPAQAPQAPQPQMGMPPNNAYYPPNPMMGMPQQPMPQQPMQYPSMGYPYGPVVGHMPPGTQIAYGAAFGTQESVMLPPNVQVYEGRPDYQALLSEAVAGCPSGEFVGQFSCGPASLMASAAQAAAKHAGKVHTHQETFEW